MVSCSQTTKVPGPSSKLDRQWMRTPWLRAYSTERSCSTFAPEAAISSISSNETTVELARVRDDPRVGAEDARHVGVDLAHVGADGGGQRDGGRVRAAAAERRHVACAVRDALEAGDEHDLVLVQRARGCGRRARRGCAPSCARCRSRCRPASRSARSRRWPRSWIAIAHSAHEIALAGRQQHVHLARVGRGGDLVGHRATSSSVVFPRADSTATTRLPCSRAATIRRAARLMRSASATEVPPNFITTVASEEAMRPAQDTAPAVVPRRARAGRRLRLGARGRDWTDGRRPAAVPGARAPPGARDPPFSACSRRLHRALRFEEAPARAPSRRPDPRPAPPPRPRPRRAVDRRHRPPTGPRPAARRPPRARRGRSRRARARGRRPRRAGAATARAATWPPRRPPPATRRSS